MEIPTGLVSLIQELGNKLHLPECVLDENGAFALQIDGYLSILIEYHPDRQLLLLLTDLGPSPVPTPIAFLEKLLRANLIWNATFGFTLSLKGELKPRVVLMGAEPWESHNAETLYSWLEDFVNTAEDWIEQLGGSIPTEKTSQLEEEIPAFFQKV